MDKETIVKRLRKLLALSASPNEAEAELALNKAQELMDKYNIRTIDVDEETNSIAIKTSYVYGYSRKRSAWETKLASAIAECLDGEVVVEYIDNKWRVVFIASKTDIEIMTDLFIRLRRIISKMGSQYANTVDTHKGQAKRAYCMGAIETIYKRLYRMYNTQEVNALVVVKKDALQKEMEDMFGKLKKINDKPPVDIWSYLRGVEDAENIALHKTVQNSKSSQTAKIH